MLLPTLFIFIVIVQRSLKWQSSLNRAIFMSRPRLRRLYLWQLNFRKSNRLLSICHQNGTQPLLDKGENMTNAKESCDRVWKKTERFWRIPVKVKTSCFPLYCSPRLCNNVQFFFKTNIFVQTGKLLPWAWLMAFNLLRRKSLFFGGM